MKLKNNDIKVIWFDEKIGNEENQKYLKTLKSYFYNVNTYLIFDEGFENFYAKKIGNEFIIVFVIVSGRLFGRYVKKLQEKLNRIVNIPYTYIFTSNNFKKLLLKQISDNEHKLSYDTMIAVNDVFYNPGGVFDDFNKLLYEMSINMKKLDANINIEPRLKSKLNYEGILTFEYLESEENLLAPALSKK